MDYLIRSIQLTGYGPFYSPLMAEVKMQLGQVYPLLHSLEGDKHNRTLLSSCILGYTETA